jgi:hypothetical protein
MGPYKISKSINLDKPIIEAKFYDETLFAVTSTDELYILDENYVLKSKIRLLKNGANAIPTRMPTVSPRAVSVSPVTKHFYGRRTAIKK